MNIATRCPSLLCPLLIPFSPQESSLNKNQSQASTEQDLDCNTNCTEVLILKVGQVLA